MESIWTKTCSIPKRETLQNDISTEIAVIGAGIAGILTAYLLQKSGKQVVVLEAGRIGSGQTRNTTAKITSQHGLMYADLIHAIGKEKAYQYAMANELAIKEYRRIIQEEHICCDFEDACAYVYSQNKDILIKEADAAASLGLPVSLTDNVSLPLDNISALCFENQAQFHPLKFIKPLADQLTIYENTPVSTAKKHIITTPKATVTAKHIVFATHYPFVNFPGMYFARMHQERSYVLALKKAASSDSTYISGDMSIDNGMFAHNDTSIGDGMFAHNHTSIGDGMFIGDGKDAISLRSYKNYLLFGGEGHRTGRSPRGGHYEALRKKARQLFPQYTEAAHWSAQDCISADNIPFIGQYAGSRPYWYVASGFKKWGMTTSMVSALLLHDLICGIDNPYAQVFDPRRFSSEMFDGIIDETKQAVKTLTRRIFEKPDKSAKELPPGHGGIVAVDGEKVGVYKSETGEIHMVNIRCPHLGCQLEWNPDEKSWDCPCHGSRFDFRGKCISNPAQEDITR